MPKVAQARLDERRQQILDAAVLCFARKGFYATTMADIASEAGVSNTLAYRYFRGKDDIIDAAVRQAAENTNREALDPDSDPDDVLTLADLLLGSNLRRFEDPRRIEATMGTYFRAWAEALHDEGIRREVVSRWRRHFDVTESLVARGQHAGQISADLDARATAWVMVALHYGSTLLGILDPEVDLARCKDVALAMLAGLVSEPESTPPDQTGRTNGG